MWCILGAACLESLLSCAGPAMRSVARATIASTYIRQLRSGLPSGQKSDASRPPLSVHLFIRYYCGKSLAFCGRGSRSRPAPTQRDYIRIYRSWNSRPPGNLRQRVTVRLRELFPALFGPNNRVIGFSRNCHSVRVRRIHVILQVLFQPDGFLEI